MIKTYLIVALVSYFLGSIPFGYILVKLFHKKDIRETGSGNIGATNVMRSGAKVLGLVTLLLDAAKGILAIFVTNRLFGNHPEYFGVEPLYMEFGNPVFNFSSYMYQAAFAGMFAVVGHLFPVWLKFKGGKGVATALGVFAVIAPKAVLVCFLVFLLTLAAFRYVSLGSILSAAIFPAVVSFTYPELRTVTFLAMATTISCLIIFKHRDNIRRLIAGTESRLGGKKPGGDAQ